MRKPVESKSKHQASQRLATRLIPSVHISRAYRTERDAIKENESSVNKKDSLYITMTGKESVSDAEGVQFEYHPYMPKPTVKAIRVKSLPSSNSLRDNPGSKRLSLVHLNSNLMEAGMMPCIV